MRQHGKSWRGRCCMKGLGKCVEFQRDVVRRRCQRHRIVFGLQKPFKPTIEYTFYMLYLRRNQIGRWSFEGRLRLQSGRTARNGTELFRRVRRGKLSTRLSWIHFCNNMTQGSRNWAPLEADYRDVGSSDTRSESVDVCSFQYKWLNERCCSHNIHR